MNYEEEGLVDSCNPLCVRFKARQIENGSTERTWTKDLTGAPAELDNLSETLLKELETSNENSRRVDLIQSLINKRLRDELAELRMSNDHNSRTTMTTRTPDERRNDDEGDGDNGGGGGTLKAGQTLEPTQTPPCQDEHTTTTTTNNFDEEIKFKTSSEHVFVDASPSEALKREATSQRRFLAGGGGVTKLRTDSFESAVDEFNPVIDDDTKLATVDENYVSIRFFFYIHLKSKSGLLIPVSKF